MATVGVVMLGLSARSLSLIPVIAVNGLGLVEQVNTPPFSAATSHDSPVVWVTLIGQAVIFLTTIAGFLYNIHRENRQRRWDLEDREYARQKIHQKVEVKAAEVKEEVRQEIGAHAVQSAAQAQAVADQVIGKIAENTAITTAAAAAAVDAKRTTETRIKELTDMFQDSNGHGRDKERPRPRK